MIEKEKEKEVKDDIFIKGEKDKLSKNEVKFFKKWSWIFIFLIFTFIVSTIVIIIIATRETNVKLPDKIDAVIVERGNNRYIQHVRSIKQNMDFIEHIYVLTGDPPSVNNDEKVTYVKFTASSDSKFLEEAFMYVKDIDGINDYSIFLGDYTFPMSKLYKNYLFYNSRPRMFNIFRDSTEVSFFEAYLNETMPTLVQSVELLKKSDNWRDVIFLETTEESVVLRGDMNKDVFVNSGMTSNVDKQFEMLDNYPPVFATFHTSGDKTKANTLLNIFLSDVFIEKAN